MLEFIDLSESWHPLHRQYRWSARLGQMLLTLWCPEVDVSSVYMKERSQVLHEIGLTGLADSSLQPKNINQPLSSKTWVLAIHADTIAYTAIKQRGRIWAVCS